MKAQELINDLQMLVNLHGNLDLIYMCDETMGCLSSVHSITVENFVPSDWVTNDMNKNLYKNKLQEKVFYIDNDWNKK